MKKWKDLDSPDKGRIARWQKGMLLLALTCETLLAADWYAFAAVLTFVSETLHLDPAQAGFAQGAFAITYGIGMLVWSPVSRSISARSMLLIGLAGTGVGMLLQVFVSSYHELVALRLLIGFFDAAIFIGNLKLIFLWFPQSRRGSVIGNILAAYSLAITLDFALGIPLTVNWGWRVFFGVLTGLTLVAAALVATFTRDGPKMIGIADFAWEDEPPIAKTPLRTIVSSRWVYVIALGLGGGTCAIVATATWAVPSFISFHGLPVSQAPLIGMVMGLSQVVFLIIGGQIADRVRKSSMVKAGALIASGVALLYVLTGLQVLDPTYLFAISALSGIAVISGGSVFALASEKYPRSLAPAAIGYAEIAALLSSFAAPWGMGLAIRSSGGSFLSGFFVFLGIELVLLLLMLVVAREPDSARRVEGLA